MKKYKNKKKKFKIQKINKKYQTTKFMNYNFNNKTKHK